MDGCSTCSLWSPTLSPFQDGPPPVVKPSLIEAPIMDRLLNLFSTVSNSAYTTNNLSLIDNCLTNSGLTAVCVCFYKKVSPESKTCDLCEFYVDQYLIATGVYIVKSGI
ncbi:hypothetical protein DPMN_147138 [Dreissena polymorpha]|uniref:Uncharacterized protein n=1 Tax=Dreissena polymorpha TaxID=45954 RepID=A0A9D4J2Q0_DREPO|nr:hypothetical protein DPMN_147138 [Dreissena polymorpha]